MTALEAMKERLKRATPGPRKRYPSDAPERLNKQTREWAEANRERSREIKRLSSKKHRAEIQARRKIKDKDPEQRKKRRAEYRLRHAVKVGWIIRPTGKHFHHVDYSRPFYGVWVTQLEHRRIHAGLMECPECIDYEEVVRAKRDESVKKRNRNGAIRANQIRWGK
jgi:hypothetical protein